VRLLGSKAALAVLLCVLFVTPPALAQKSTEDGLRDCEKLAAIKFKQENSAFKKFAIERAGVNEDVYSDKVGTQPVTTVYHGNALYQAGGEPANARFICLHAGLGKGAVFVYIMLN
jgi:hypothetical protein